MAQFARCQFFGVNLTKSKLDRGIPIPFRVTYLCNITWPSLDDCHRICDTLLIEDLGHADLLSNKPFQHTLFSPSKKFMRLSAGASAASSPGSTVNDWAGRLVFCYPGENRSCTVETKE